MVRFNFLEPLSVEEERLGEENGFGERDDVSLVPQDIFGLILLSLLGGCCLEDTVISAELPVLIEKLHNAHLRRFECLLKI